MERNGFASFFFATAPALYVTQMHSEVRPAPPLECQANKCEGNSPPILLSSNDYLDPTIGNMQVSPLALLRVRLTCCVACWRRARSSSLEPNHLKWH